MWICVDLEGKPLQNAYNDVLVFNDHDTARAYAVKHAATVKRCCPVRKGSKP